MCANLRQTGGTGNIFVKTFYTDYRMDAERLKKIKDYTQQLDKNDLVIWIHFKTDKEVTGDLYFGPGLEERLTKNYVDHTKAFLAGALKLGHKFTSIPVKGIAYVASNLGKLLSLTEIPAIYYDPGLGEQYNPAFYIMYYVGSTSSSGGVGIIANSITSDDDNFALKIRDGAMRDFGNRQLEFAFITGLWNGTVTELASFSQAVSMICDAYTDPPAIKEVNQIINSLLNGQAYDAVIQQVKDRYDSRQSSYAILHNSGRDVIAVITLFIGVGELNGAVKVSKTFATMAEAAKMLDFLTLTRYLSKTVNGIKLYKLVITNSTYFFKVLKQNTSIAFKLVNDVGVVLKNTDVSILRQIEWQLADGSIVKSTIFVDPSDNITGAIRYTKDLVKDAYGNRVIEVTDNAGNTHAVVEVKDATKIVDDAGELLTLLAKAEAKLPTPELKAAFRSDFGNNLEMLRRFDGEGGLVESWETVSKHADLRTNAKFLENISGYSDDLLKQLDDDLLNPKWADELKTLFKESPDDVTNVWKKLKEDPVEAWEISKADPSWEKWSQREFFKEVTALGKRFEEVTRAKILDKSSDLYTSLNSSLKGKGLNIDDYEIFPQVQLKYSGDNYFVGDIVMIRKEVNAVTGQVKTKAVILETKLRNITSLTPPQTNALNKVKGPEKGLITRSKDIDGEINRSNILTQNSSIEVEDFIKIWGDGSGEVFSGLNSLID